MAQRLDRVARARADSIAVVDGARRLTYGELLGRADALASRLNARGIGPGDLVGVALPRSAELVAAVVGIARAGAAYVPIDLAHPEERRAMVLADAAPRAVVAESAAAAGVPEGMHVVTLPDSAVATSEGAPIPAPGDPAYVIYTSGSTGRPKGVVVTQRNLSRLFTTTQPIFRFGPDDVWTLFHSIAFDFSVWEMWGALLHGGRLVVVPSATARASDAFHSLAVREGVTVLNQTPSAFRAFDAADAAAGRPKSALRHVVFGGEALDPRTLGPWFGAHGDEAPRLVNMYGITETTVHTTWRRVRATDSRSRASLIGVPLPDLRIDLLGADGLPVPDGVTGEIHVGGAGVADGYIRRRDLTAERFIPDPRGDGPGARLYRSGDLARRTPDGDLEYMGRADDQVKLRGFRIELGEIEAALRDAPRVREAVAALRDDPVAGARIVAYVVADGAEPLDPHALRAHAVARVPEYMVPSAYVRIAAVPRTVNDKIDRAALPDPTEADLPRGPGREAPRTATEKEVEQIWREVLGVERAGRDDDFVALGGHSLLAIRVAARCIERLRAAITGLDVLEARTLAELAARVDAAPRVEPFGPGTPALASSPLTPGQASVLVQQELAGSAPVLNEGFALELRGDVDARRIAAELAATLDGHPALRSRFVERDGGWAQEIAAGSSVEVEIADAPGASGEALDAMLRATALRAFDVTRGPLARALIVTTARDRCALLVVAHHLVIDEWSFHLVLEELGERLCGRTPTGRLDPGPFAHAVRRSDADRAAKQSDRDFWRTELDGASLGLECAPVAELAADANAGGVAEAQIDVAETARIRTALRASGVTEFEAGLAALAAVLEHETHRPDVVALVTLADRDRPDAAGLAGYLLDVLPVRVRLDGDPTAREVLARTRAGVARAGAHRSLPVGEAVAAAGLSIVPATHGAGAVFYTRQEGVAPRLRVPGVEVVQRPLHLGVAKFDVSVHLLSDADQLRVRVEHRSQAVDGATARRLAARVARHLGVFATAPQTRLSALDLLDAEERRFAVAASRGPAGPPGPWPLVPARVGEVARDSPDAPAVVENGRSVSYGDLLAAADGLARRLRELGVGPGDVVPVLGRRSASLVASWLGVLRAGAAYAPVDADQPPARRAAMIEDCGARAVVAEGAFREGISPGLTVLDLAATSRVGRDRAAKDPAPRAGGDHLAYVVFTSGSTGRPKGVEIGHEALAHVVAWHRRRLGLSAADRVPLLSGIGFDATVLETWATLCSGGALVLVDDEVRLAPQRLRDWIVESGITTAFAPTVIAEGLLALEWPAAVPLRSLEAGGEVLRSRPRAGLPFQVVNLYGPAESAVWVSHSVVTPDGDGLPPIGVPLDDVGAHVVDHRGRLCAHGTLGELWLSGPQTGRGYRGLPERTAASFPEVEIEAGRRERVYRTGDLVRRAEDGVLHFVGRRDSQVKLRGVRIEIGEIEAALLTHPAVAGCAVALRGGAAAPYLAAYVEPAERSRPISEESLVAHLAARLPRAMIPTRWAVLGALARTPNGKIDRKALPEIESSAPAAGGEAPGTGTECAVARIFSEVLGVPVATLDADLFRLGGSSMSAVRIVAQIGRELGVTVPVRSILAAPTVRGFSALLDERLAERVADEPVAPSSVLRMRDGDGSAPLFCLPGMGGHAFQYRQLADRMRSKRAILGLQLYDLAVPASTFESIDATAAAFVREIRSVQPHGPYALTGYSYGGYVALEMARQLMDAGETVSFLGFVDTYAPGSTEPEPPLTKARMHVANVVGAESFREAFDYVGVRVRRRMRRLRFRAREIGGADVTPSNDFEQHVEETSIRCRRAMDAYVTRRFPGRITVFHATRLMDWVRVNDATGTCGWGPLCAGVDVVEIDCKHLDFFVEPHISELARRLDEALDLTALAR